MNNTRLLRFGIPSLDRLFSQKSFTSDAGINLRTSKSDDGKEGDQHVSLCIQGPSGTGKSVLGLHLASRYWSDSLKWQMEETGNFDSPKILYLSTDLGIKRARFTWESFCLNEPEDRILPFNERTSTTLKAGLGWNVTLTSYLQKDLDKLAEYMDEKCENPKNGKVAFIDLAESTAGDDWGFIIRLVSLLTSPNHQQPHHLLIIDAVEGLELFTGDTDAFGQTRSRRSRIAQILRAAVGKCHIVVILEEDSVHQHPAEEYVADIVMRLRVSKEENYYRRSLEIVKARGQTHIRGDHDYVIRQGRDQHKIQEPYLILPDDPILKGSYVHVLRSLHSLSRGLMYDDEEKSPNLAKMSNDSLALMLTPRMGFILPSLQVAGRGHVEHKNEYHHTYSGLRRGLVTSLIGDEATMKSRFGRAFLSGAFAPRITKEKQQAEAAILITTFNYTHEEIKNKLVYHWGKQDQGDVDEADVDEAKERMKTLLIYRQLEVHHLNSSHLFHIVRRCVEHALKQLEKYETGIVREEPERVWSDLSQRAGRVRVVIDDWSLIQSTYPEIAADRLFLPFLIKYFKRVGVSALIIATQPGRPEEILSGTSEQPLRALADYHLYTWHVSFYGRDRVAITAMPPMNEYLPPSVGELRNPALEEVDKADERSERLWLDNHFELYKGVDKNNPQPVPLEVHLFSGAEGFEEYAGQMGGILNRLFIPQQASQVLIPENHARYAELRDFSSLHGSIHCDHSIVIQLDEYWKKAEPRDVKATNSRDERAAKYLQQKSYDILHEGISAPVHDPFSLFQPPAKYKEGRNQYQKHEFFDPSGYGENWWEKVSGIPYQWDFGFLLLKQHAWERDVDQSDMPENIKRNILKVYKSLTKATDVVSWHDFFYASLQVSLLNNRPGMELLSPFDLDTRGPQSFACLVLEIWASEIKLTNRDLFSKAFPKCRHADEYKYDKGLYEMLGENIEASSGDSQKEYWQYRFTLFRSWMLLAEVLDPKSLTTDITRLAARPASHTSVAERQWYSTGSLAWKEIGGNSPVVPARLPGCGSVRGDWFLMIGKESRSQRLAERAIDLLCRRRRNQDRLELGLGLPMRKLNDTAWGEKAKPSEAYSELFTAMVTFEPLGRRRFVRYGELLNLGCHVDSDEFQWLWRSRLKDYHRDDRVWEKWLGRILVEACKHACRIRHELHEPPFAAYELVKSSFEGTGLQVDSPRELIIVEGLSESKQILALAVNKAWEKFNARCDSLVSELR